MDPKEFKSSDELAYAYSQAYGFAKAGQEILDQVQRWSDEADLLTKKEQGEVKDKIREAFE